MTPGRSHYLCQLAKFFAILGLLGICEVATAQTFQQCSGGPGIRFDRLRNKYQTYPNSDVQRQKVVQILEAWLETNERIGRVAGVVNHLMLCFEPDYAYTIGPNLRQPIRITPILAELLGTDKQLIAAVLGHEYGHLIKHHVAKRIEDDKYFEARRQAIYLQFRAQDRYWGLDRENQISAAQHANFDYFLNRGVYLRKQEVDADTWGIRAAKKAGFQSSGFASLAILLARETGQLFTMWSDTHPGWFDRLETAKTVIVDEEIASDVGSAISKGKKNEAASLISKWLNIVPYSGKGWYYRSVLLGMLNDGYPSIIAMGIAHASIASPPLDFLDDESNNEAMLWLCKSLFHIGHWSESAWCGRRFLLPIGAGVYEDFLASTWGIVIVGGAEPPRGALAFVSTPNGGKLITNDEALATSILGGVTPDHEESWRPIYFQSCEDFTRCIGAKKNATKARSTSKK